MLKSLARGIFVLVMILAGYAHSAQAMCLGIPGDITDSGSTDVVDVVCSVNVVLSELSGGAPPECLAVDTQYVDFNCDESINVTDVIMVVKLSISALDPIMDSNGNQCADACEDPSCNCDGACVEYCNGSDDDCDGFVDEGNVCGNDQEIPMVIDGLNGDMFGLALGSGVWGLSGNVGFSGPAFIDAERLESGDVLLLVNSALYRMDAASQEWENQGDTGSYITAICSHPLDGGKVYGTSSSGQFFTSEDNFTTSIGAWTPEGASVECVVLPSGRIVVFDSSYVGDTYYSDDGGLSFQPGGSYGEFELGNLANAVVDGAGTIFVGTGTNKVLASTDGGLSFVYQGTIPSDPLTVQSMAVTSIGTLYAVTPNAGSLGGKSYVSIDAGHTWYFLTDWKGTSASSGWAEIFIP